MSELEYLTDTEIKHTTEWHAGNPPRIGPYLVTFIGDVTKLHLVGVLTYSFDNRWHIWGTKEVFDMPVVAWSKLPLPAR